MFQSFSEGLRHRRSDLYREVFSSPDERKPAKKAYKALPTLVGFIIPILGTVIIQLIILINKQLPDQVTIADEINQPDRLVIQLEGLHLPCIREIFVVFEGLSERELQTT